MAEAERLMDEFGFAEAPTASLAHRRAGMLLERAGDLDGADAAYARAAELARRGGWPLDLAHALLLHAALRRRRRDFAGARALPREAATGAGGLRRRRRPRRAARPPRALARRSGRAPQATDAELSERELDVLRLLATDLSQREIGAELFVSFNTVKSHTRTVFRKLGVSSREDAVARGRELGLL